MLYGILRIFFWGIVFLSTYFLLTVKLPIARKKMVVIITLAFCLILGSVSALIPVENLFFSFKSPDSVLQYYQTGKVDDILYGNDSCLIIYSKGSNLGGHLIVPKSAKGYKIPSLFSVNKVFHKLGRDGNFDVYNVLGTNDYYVVGTMISKDSAIDMVDSNNESVKTIIIEMENTDTKTVLFYSFVENYTETYYMLINREKVFISD